MYRLVDTIDDDTHAELVRLADNAEWKTVEGSGRKYETAPCEARFRWGDWHQGFFLKIPPGGYVHKHVDVDHPWDTYHVVVSTNPDVVSYMAGTPLHLIERGIYEADRQVEHWSVNEGETDRIHLIAEVYGQD